MRILIKGMRILYAALALVALTVPPSHAATRVENVRFDQQRGQVLIFYDLHGSEETYTITLKGSSDGGRRFDLVPKTLSGDVGENISPGTGRRMVWEALKDVEGLSGDDFVFAVTASWDGGRHSRDVKKNEDERKRLEEDKRRMSYIPLLNGYVTKLRFFEGPHFAKLPPPDKRVHKNRVPTSNAKCIAWELWLKYPKQGRRVLFKITTVLYSPDGSEYLRDRFWTSVNADWTWSHHSKQPFQHTLGWKAGSYRVDLYFGGHGIPDKKVASGSFELY